MKVGAARVPTLGGNKGLADWHGNYKLGPSRGTCLEKAKEDRLELEAKVTKIYVDHLLVENEIGPGEECKFPNLIQYTKHQFSKQHENYLQTNRDIAAHRLDFEQLDEKCTNQFEKEIPTEMHLKQEGINECKRMIWELENNTLK